ncbi:hypothetical protein LTR78_001746 [Recurvomyces mirabilis]|uniref:Uncharacterized protein n=1 Tax=Recurvomyces mirabilis TaxID=574656 RepID=A0AAE0WV84_9PEZI|nr:hypothetical protein LTR78_001746 [Recurvomyces mirabilis]KAK5150179.1 hypothetical protein LTS14_010308 [Recurvomyces mirabilis]
MAGDLEQIIARLQDVRNKRSQAQGLVGDLQICVTEHKAQLAEARKKLGDARRSLQEHKDTATGLIKRFSDEPQHTPATPVTVGAIPVVAETSAEAARLSIAECDSRPNREGGHMKRVVESIVSSGTQRSQSFEPLEVIHTRFENVVLLDVDWTEIRCHLCGTNACGDGRLFKGLSGLYNHIKGKHSKGKTVYTRQDILEKCTKRLIDA